MRLIGHLPTETSASVFSDYLDVQGISNEIEAGADGWEVWIHSEDEWMKARELLAGFLGNPADPKYRQAAAPGTIFRDADFAARATEREGGGRFLQSAMPHGVGALTAVFVGLCLITQLLRTGGYEGEILRELFITAVENAGGSPNFRPGLLEIQQGEFWRLFTPAMVHRDWLHLLLNLMWLLDLGSMVEGRKGTGMLGLLVVVIAVASNLAEYLLAGPVFCGMSGVVYGLLGYVWVKGRLDAASGLRPQPHTALLMIFWFFLSLAGVVPKAANGAQAAGLVLGAAWGLLTSLAVWRRKIP